MIRFQSNEWLRSANLEPLKQEVAREIDKLRAQNDDRGKTERDTAFLRGQIAAYKELLTAFERGAMPHPPGRPQQPDLPEFG